MIPVCAFAAGGGSITVTPSPAQDGQQVSVTVSGCSNTTGTATSKAFAKPVMLTGKQGKLSGTGTISKTAKPNRYKVQTVCTVGKTKTTIKTLLTVKKTATPPKPATPGQPKH